MLSKCSEQALHGIDYIRRPTQCWTFRCRGSGSVLASKFPPTLVLQACRIYIHQNSDFVTPKGYKISTTPKIISGHLQTLSCVLFDASPRARRGWGLFGIVCTSSRVYQRKAEFLMSKKSTSRTLRLPRSTTKHEFPEKASWKKRESCPTQGS